MKHGESAHRDGKLDAVELLRILAACGVVWFHVPGGDWKDAGYAGLICFVMISSFFQMAGARKSGFEVFFGKRLARIVAPWAFWMAVYGGFNLIRGEELFPYSEGILKGALTGTWIGLWYLPFVLLMSVLVFVLAKLTGSAHPLAGGCLFLLMGISTMCALPQIDARWAATTPWAQWLHALPAVFLGLSLYEMTLLSPRLRGAMAVAMASLAGAAAAWLWKDHPGMSVTYGIAVLPALAAFLTRPRLPSALVGIGTLCLGVYLTHALFISALKLLPVFRDSPVGLFASALILSFAAAAALRSNRLSKFSV